MAEPKTRPTDQPVSEFIESLTDESTRQDCRTILKLMGEVSGVQPVMWGTSIVGFDQYPLTGSDGKTNVWPLIAFSPRKQALTLYLSLQGISQLDEKLARLGKHSTGKVCLYIKRLSDVDLSTLSELVRESYENDVKTKLGLSTTPGL
ncbi:DUF1801 domain-containing protein [bacterium]|nr:DUF1801 domain-containing protein [bacterium]